MNGSAEDLVPRMEALFVAWMAAKGKRSEGPAAVDEACCADAACCEGEEGCC